MNTLKVKTWAGRVIPALFVVLFLFGCQTETETQQTEEQSFNDKMEQIHKSFMDDLINSTESKAIKEWLSLTDNDDLTTEGVRLFKSFNQKELLEAFEILYKIHMFDLEYTDIPEIEKSHLITEAEMSRDYRENLANNTYQKFNKTIMNLNEVEKRFILDNDDGVNNNMRGQCARKRIFSSSAKLTNVTIWSSNCKNYFSTTSCKQYYYGAYADCQSDCDVEYEFESSDKYYTKFRFTTQGVSIPGVPGGSSATAAAMQAYAKVQYNSKAGRRTEFRNGKRYTYLLMGDNMATVFGGKWRVKTFLSMH